MALERYRQALEYLDSFIHGPAESLVPKDPSELHASRLRRLPRVSRFLELLGRPQDAFTTIHVGGTSGKGSTSILIGSILRAAGYRVGVHTTPYLQSPVEKLMVDGRYIHPEELATLVEEMRPVVAQMTHEGIHGPPLYGDLWVGLTLAHFARRRVDYAVVEVGVGGRYDATNVLHPRVSVITNVSYDHVPTLGNTLEEIAWHKAGIIKPRTPAVTGITQPGPLAVVEREAQEQGARLWRLGREFSYQVKDVSRLGSVFDYHGPTANYYDLEISLLGAHQVTNAVLGLAALEALQGQDVCIPEEAIRRGLRTASFPGRLELMQRRPLVVLDGAHNPEKARSLRLALEQLFLPHVQRLILVLGVLQVKDAAEILRELVPLSHLVIATAPQVVGKPAVEAADLAQEVQGMGVSALCQPDPRAAVQQALEIADPDDLVCVTGSLYLVGQVRERWVKEEELLMTRAEV